MPKIILIVAIASNNVIGDDGHIPWKLSSDLKRFKELTLGNPIIMGYRTFLSIKKKPLPGRLNIVLTRNNRDDVSGSEIKFADSIDHSLEIAYKTESKKVFFIGGQEIYTQTINRADNLYVTHIEAAIKGDAFFPPIDPSCWQEKGKQIFIPASEKDEYPTRFVIYHRRFLEKIL
ncbi:MAG: dihydrofolate reductase [Candidatus Liberibacter solanacearum]|uniref:dihydrofolate reductase n=1 Tax=Candidatus Liberibacter solanacearum TaxID=556287 RepID=UPI000978F7B2|nr:dihydrofolate reductase [Candidatus Liberibacter solanacearum]ONI58963.1 diacylglycerol kinase [Candidatus Liberibacter solanacearum]